MKIIFVLPDMSWLYDYKAQFSLGILYLSSVIKQHGDEVELFDTNVDSIEDIGEADVYAFSVVSSMYDNAVDLAKSIKTKYTTSKIIIGGVRVTLDPDNIDEIFDSKFIGESEKTIAEYIEDFKQDKCKPEYRQITPIDLNGLFPARDTLEDSYIRTGSIFTGGKVYDDNGSTAIMFSRGCPYHCTFCASPKVYAGVRFRDVDDIIDEVKLIKEEYGIRQFRVQDDTFTLKKSFLKELTDKLIPLDIYYRCSTRVNHVDDERIKMLYDSGCREIGIGVEVAEDNALDKLDKGITVKAIEDAIKIIRKYPITIRCFFMIGLPFDSELTVKSNIEFIEKNDIKNVVVGNLLPFKGTKMYDEKESFNIKNINVDGCMNVAKHIPFVPNIERTDISVEEHIEIMKPFYDFLVKKDFIF